MAHVSLRLFASARQAAGRSHDGFDVERLDDLLAAARARYGPQFAAVLDTARVWLNGDEPPAATVALADGDEVAVLPPVSGGS